MRDRQADCTVQDARSNVRKTFMYVGGSVGPPRALAGNKGPVIQRIHTYS